MTDKKVIETVKSLTEFCKQQRGCQNCILRKYASDHWDCQLNVFDMRDIVGNYEAKKKNRGYI